MKKRIILHIGTHKTGTTSIQKSLVANQEKLLANGVLYPDTTREPWPNLPKHCSVAYAARSDDEIRINEEKQHLLDEFAGSQADTMIVSEEALSEPDPCFPEFFKSMRDDYELSVICYLRRQDLFIESLYNQFVRVPERLEARSINQFWKEPGVQNRLKYYAILKRWAEVTVDMTVMDFDHAVRNDGLVKSFIKAARLDIDLPETAANRSPDMNLILCLSEMNRLGLDLRLQPLLKAAKHINNKFKWPPLKQILGANERRKILRKFEKQNNLLRKEFNLSFSADMPESEPSLPIVSADIDYLLTVIATLSFAAKEAGADS